MFEYLPLQDEVARRFANDLPDTRRRARLVAAFGVMGLVGALLLIGSHLAWLDIPAWYALPPAVAAVMSLAVSLVVLRWKAVDLGAHLCAASWLLVTGWGVFLRGGHAAPSLMCLGTAPFIASALLHRRAAAVWAVPAAVELAVVVGLGLAGVPTPDLMPEPYRLASDVAAAVLFGALMVAMGLAQEWLRSRASAELAEAERRKVAAEHEAELARADRLASLGQMAAGVAHELNNPLTYLQTNLELLEEHHLGEDAGASVKDALEAAARIKVIVRDLKDYSRFDERLAPVHLEAVVRTGVRLARGELKRVALRTDFEPCPLVEANEVRLGQVLVNLLVNATQAGAGEVAVSTRTDPAGNAVLAVRDTGQGIPSDLLRKVREPFFTTKPAGVGTGLGLSVCDKLVRELGGVMTIESTVGVGTTVTLVLPPASVRALSAPSGG